MFQIAMTQGEASSKVDVKPPLFQFDLFEVVTNTFLHICASKFASSKTCPGKMHDENLEIEVELRFALPNFVSSIAGRCISNSLGL